MNHKKKRSGPRTDSTVPNTPAVTKKEEKSVDVKPPDTDKWLHRILILLKIVGLMVNITEHLQHVLQWSPLV